MRVTVRSRKSVVRVAAHYMADGGGAASCVGRILVQQPAIRPGANGVTITRANPLALPESL